MRRAWPAGVLAVALVALAAAPARAEGPDLLSPRFDLTIWSIVVFALLFWVLRKFAWKPMLEGLQKREHSIQAALDESKRAQEEAQNLRAKFQKDMAEAEARARTVVDEAEKRAQRSADDLITKARGEIQAERDRLRREIDLAKDNALKDIWAQAANLSTMVSGKVIKRNLSADDHRRLVDEAVAEVRQAAAQRQG